MCAHPLYPYRHHRPLGALPEDLHQSACQSREEARACRLYPHYQQELAAQGLLDFDDLVMVRRSRACLPVCLPACLPAYGCVWSGQRSQPCLTPTNEMQRNAPRAQVALDLLLSYPEVLRKYQHRFKHILVDEFQVRVLFDCLLVCDL